MTHFLQDRSGLGTSAGNARGGPAGRVGASVREAARAFRYVADSWAAKSLVERFLVLGGIVSLLAILVIGSIVTMLIQNAATRNAAATTALYVDSVIAPLLPNMQEARPLDDVVSRALDETLGQGALGERIEELRLWAPDGTILYSDDPALTGTRLQLPPALSDAFEGKLVARLERSEGLVELGAAEPAPVLQIYNPIRQPWSGEVVAVIELHESAGDLRRTLRNALLVSWASVAATIGGIFAALFATILPASRTIEHQGRALEGRVAELTDLLKQNEELHQRVQRATQRSAARNERFLRRLGAELHDGPAQLIALASLRLESGALLKPDAPPAEREREIQSIRAHLAEAMNEVRNLCQGLMLPRIETESLPEVAARAINAYEQRTGMTVEVSVPEASPPLSASERICIYRFIQEGLNNGYRHCRGAKQSVTVATSGDAVSVTVVDEGPGFDPDSIDRQSLGLSGLRDRVESLGGRFWLSTGPEGTRLTMELKSGARAG